MGTIAVLGAGLQTTLQDLGRPGHSRLGVSAAGPADAIAFRVANRLAGNPDNTPAIEMTLLGGAFRFESPAGIAIAGADMRPEIDGTRAPLYATARVNEGQELRFGPALDGARAYLAVRGGVAGTRVLGSVSTHVASRLGGIEGRALRKGDRLDFPGGPMPPLRTYTPEAPPTGSTSSGRVPAALLRVTDGAEALLFDDGARALLFGAEYVVTEEANRMGLRLDGPAISIASGGGMVSEGMPLGALQIPPGGRPVILFVDHQTTGGYPVIASVVSADLPRVGQLRPRDRVRFERVSLAAAQALLLEQEARLNTALPPRVMNERPQPAAPIASPAIDARAWRALGAAFLGWMLDGMDIMLFAFALGAIREEFALSPGQAGGLASLTLLTSAAGGIFAGALADRHGRARVLIWSILAYAFCTGAAATSGSVWQLAFWRALVGFGLGGEWSAGSVLVAESWPAEHRGKAIGFVQSGWAIGYILAAILAAVVLPRWGWRALFVLGVLPAFVTLWVRRRVEEPEIWKRHASLPAERLSRSAPIAAILRPPLRRLTLAATALATCLMFAYWGFFTWIPTFLASPLEEGGAGLGIVRSTAFIIPMQLGAFAGYTMFGLVADRIGRRPAFVLFVLGAAILVPLYGLGTGSPTLLLLLGPLIGFFGHGYFSLFGAMLAELFPSGVRATAQGLCYNSGRALSALAPTVIGAASERLGYGTALAILASFYVLGAGLIFLLPETRGRELV